MNGHSARALARFCFSVRAPVKYGGSVPKKLITSPIQAAVHLPKLRTSPLCLLPRSISLLDATQTNIYKQISDPLANLRIDITPPPLQKPKDVSVPSIKETEYIEPPQPGVFEKQAVRMIVIRRRKMKKHKYKKLQKRMKYFNMKKRQRRELLKEKNFQAVLLAKIKEAEQWNPEEYVSSQLEMANWKRPITHIRKFRAPDWVIRDHLNAKAERERIGARIRECVNFKKQ